MTTTLTASGRVTGQILAASYANPATICKAPPGAGKSTTASRLVALHHADGHKVAVATPTRSQGMDLASTIAQRFPHIPVIWANDHPPTGIRGISSTRQLPDDPHVAVTTVAKWAYLPESMRTYDVLVVDEAFQVTDAAFARIATIADRVVLMGDPGQIAPVVTVDVAQWAAELDSPVRPAPDALLARHPSVPVIELPATWRFGPDTAQVISRGFYDWSWTSNRSPGHLDAPDALSVFGDGIELAGAVLPALTGGPRSDPGMAAALADLARTALHGTIRTPDGDRPVRDVFIVAAHVDQVAAARAATADLDKVTVDTAERLQGRQADVVLAWHPASGLQQATEFQRDAGRLCVMLSRHRYAAMLVYRAGTLDLPVAATGRTLAPGQDPVRQILRAHRTLREVITAREVPLNAGKGPS